MHQRQENVGKCYKREEHFMVESYWWLMTTITDHHDVRNAEESYNSDKLLYPMVLSEYSSIFEYF